MARAQFQRCFHRPADVVFMSRGGAESGIQVAALIADVQLQQGAFVAGQDGLDTDDESIKLFAGLLVIVVVNADEAQEKGDGRAQFGEKGAVPALIALEDGGQDPRAQGVGLQEKDASGANGAGIAVNCLTLAKRSPLSAMRQPVSDTVSAKAAAVAGSISTSPVAARCSAVDRRAIVAPARASRR